eukprot:g7382.t1
MDPNFWQKWFATHGGNGGTPPPRPAHWFTSLEDAAMRCPNYFLMSRFPKKFASLPQKEQERIRALAAPEKAMFIKIKDEMVAYKAAREERKGEPRDEED